MSENYSNLKFNEIIFNVIDFETTGMSPANSRVIEVGIVTIENLKIKNTYSSLINPGCDIPYFISKLTGITNNDIQDAPYFEDIADTIFNIVEKGTIVAHNLPFDLPFLRKELFNSHIEYSPKESLCTLKIARKIFPELKSKSLSSVTNHLKVIHKNVHRALGDATVTAKILIKMFKVLEEKYNISTIEELNTILATPLNKVQAKYGKTLTDNYSHIPEMPGVYFFKNEKDKVYYIGKSKSLRHRIKSHFADSSERKSKRIVNASDKLEFIETNTELTALLAEAELIKNYKPKYNSMLKKFGDAFFLTILNEKEYPILKVTNEFNFDGNDYFGPFPKRELANELLEIINNTFQLRTCSDKVLAKKKICYLHSLEMCLAPCQKDITYDIYSEELTKVYNFLQGKNQEAVNLLLAKMKRFSDRKEYEKAAEIRDLINSILKQVNKFATIKDPINKTNILIEVDGKKINDYLLLTNGKIFVKEDKVNGNNDFDYHYNLITTNENYDITTPPDSRDLERLKILLSWLVKNFGNYLITKLS